MSDAAPKPTSSSPANSAKPATEPNTGLNAGPPADEPQGSLGAVLIGAAILLVAGLLIFWPSGETATSAGKAGGKDGGQQASNSVDGSGVAGGKARGITPRELDPVTGRVGPQVREGLMAPNNGMALAPQPPPEPTSFSSVAEEIAHLEKKLTEARDNLASRTVFLERMKKMQAEAPISEHERTSQRAKIVQDNYDKAQSRVDDIQYKLNVLRKQQGG